MYIHILVQLRKLNTAAYNVDDYAAAVYCCLSVRRVFPIVSASRCFFPSYKLNEIGPPRRILSLHQFTVCAFVYVLRVVAGAVGHRAAPRARRYIYIYRDRQTDTRVCKHYRYNYFLLMAVGGLLTRQLNVSKPYVFRFVIDNIVVTYEREH